MPYTKVWVSKVSNHRVMSSLKNDIKSCMQCHTESAEWLRDQVIAIQDRWCLRWSGIRLCDCYGGEAVRNG